LYTVSGVASAMVSRGLAMPCRWRCDKCK
jgi:hypothetical protein